MLVMHHTSVSGMSCSLHVQLEMSVRGALLSIAAIGSNGMFQKVPLHRTNVSSIMQTYHPIIQIQAWVREIA